MISVLMFGFLWWSSISEPRWQRDRVQQCTSPRWYQLWNLERPIGFSVPNWPIWTIFNRIFVRKWVLPIDQGPFLGQFLPFQGHWEKRPWLIQMTQSNFFSIVSTLLHTRKYIASIRHPPDNSQTLPRHPTDTPKFSIFDWANLASRGRIKKL